MCLAFLDIRCTAVKFGGNSPSGLSESDNQEAATAALLRSFRGRSENRGPSSPWSSSANVSGGGCWDVVYVPESGLCHRYRKQPTPVQPRNQHNRARQVLFACRRCSRSFTKTYFLVSHTSAVHTDRPKTYIRVSRKPAVLTDHNSAMFSCGNCSRSFAEKYGLVSHISAEHDRHREHSFSICTKSFAKLTNLKRDQNKLHGINEATSGKQFAAGVLKSIRQIPSYGSPLIVFNPSFSSAPAAINRLRLLRYPNYPHVVPRCTGLRGRNTLGSLPDFVGGVINPVFLCPKCMLRIGQSKITEFSYTREGRLNIWTGSYVKYAGRFVRGGTMGGRKYFRWI